MTSSALPTLHPLVEWAQRDKILYLTVEIDNVNDLDITDKSLRITGTFGGNKTLYEASLEFYDNIKTDYRKIDNNRHLELVINKEASKWWPRLLKDAVKLPWVKVDFNKWKDEDEDEDFGGSDYDFQNYMSKLGSSGGPGKGPADDDFYDTDSMPDLEDADSEEADGTETKETDAKGEKEAEEKKEAKKVGEKEEKEEVVVEAKGC